MPERRRPSRSLTTRLLVTITLASLAAVASVSILTFSLTYQQSLSSRLDTLKAHSLSRIEQEAWPFEQAARNTELLANAFLTAYQRALDDPQTIEVFDNWANPVDGIYRLKPELAEGYQDGPYWIEHVSGFLGRYEHPYTDEFKTRVVSATRTLAQYAPAWQETFANTHISMPENALIHHAVDHHWGLVANSTLDIRQGAVVASTLQANNPERLPGWTGLYYDESAQYWAVTYQRPIDYAGQHLITPSHDLYLSDIIERLIAPQLENTRHFLFNQQGQLIARPNNLPDESRFAGVLYVDRLESDFYRDLYDYISATPPSAEQPVVQIGRHNGELMIAAYFAETGWWYVTAYQEHALQTQAALAASWQVLQGVIILVLVMTIVYIFTRKQVAQPLRQLVGVADTIARGEFSKASTTTRDTVQAKYEIGLLNRTMGTMAERIEADQRQLSARIDQRTQELADANEQLALLVHVDGLTGALNRRALDRDLTQAINEQTPFALILCDVDHFKRFNDSQGHVAGDKVLKQIVSTLKATTDARVYRYGGEEIAILCKDIDAIDTCHQLAERLRAAVETLAIAHPHGVNGRVTISAGIGRYVAGYTSDDVIAAADNALYRAKLQGRNRVATLHPDSS